MSRYSHVLVSYVGVMVLVWIIRFEWAKYFSLLTRTLCPSVVSLSDVPKEQQRTMDSCPVITTVRSPMSSSVQPCSAHFSISHLFVKWPLVSRRRPEVLCEIVSITARSMYRCQFGCRGPKNYCPVWISFHGDMDKVIARRSEVDNRTMPIKHFQCLFWENRFNSTCFLPRAPATPRGALSYYTTTMEAYGGSTTV